jgi:hypothetical protein
MLWLWVLGKEGKKKCANSELIERKEGKKFKARKDVGDTWDRTSTWEFNRTGRHHLLEAHQYGTVEPSRLPRRTYHR